MADTYGTDDFRELTKVFRSIIKDGELVFKIFDEFPIPIEIFDPDGFNMYQNRAGLQMVNCTDPSLLIGKYNLLHDPVCNEIMGKEAIEKAFRGEYVYYPDFSAPIQDVKDRGVTDEKPWETSTMDLHMQPVWDGDTFLCTICWFIVKTIYTGRQEIQGAKKYMDEHWLDDYDENAVASAVHVNPKYLAALFRQNADTTMYNYYKKVKIDHIKEKLIDKNFSVAEVFDACGVDSRGSFARIFKEMTGMTPTQYRAGL